MGTSDYRHLFPKSGETCQSYCKRLEDAGHEEMFIRKALRAHWDMPLREFGAFFENYPKARLRHVALLYDLRPTRTEQAFAQKISQNLGISLSLADAWVKRFHNLGSRSRDI